MTCPRKWRLLRFKLKSSAASDGSVQKLGNNARCNSELIATKLCSHICCKWRASIFDIGTKPHVPNQILCKAAGLYLWPVQGNGVFSDSNWKAQLLQMAVCKSLETMPGVILNWLQPNFAAISVAKEMWCLKAMEWPVLTGQASIFWAIFLCKHSSTMLLTKHP